MFHPRGNVERRPAVIRLRIDRGAPRQEEVNDIHAPAVCCPVEWRPSSPIFRAGRGAMIQQRSHEIDRRESPHSRMKRRPPVGVSRINRSATREKHPRHADPVPQRGQVQRRSARLIVRIDSCTSRKQET